MMGPMPGIKEKAFGRDVPDAEIHFLNAGHFALNEEVGAIAALIRRFLRTRLIPP